MAASDRIVHEIPRFSFEERIAEAYMLMVTTRTILKVKMKKSKYIQFGQELRDFYASFMLLFGMLSQKIDSDHGNKLKERILKWDNEVNVLPQHKLTALVYGRVLTGIKLSEEFQEVLKSNGIFT
jgi:hypothetical protein